ncbi:MAG: DeoR family transcriptional regulator, partial [Candidatus Staskawiczbacteria bacterium]|nr:DeoR family transcriptional regulator [Candidatus Staskawiczbacteria bacterium]
DFLIREYISTAEPVSSLALKNVINLDVCGATIRNDLQVLTEEGYIKQPHTSAGRIPTEKAYKHFSDKVEKKEREKSLSKNQNKEFEDFIVRQTRLAHEQMLGEMKMMEHLMQKLENDNIYETLTILEIWHKRPTN